MTDTVEMIDPVTGEIIDERQLAEQLLAQAREQGVGLMGPGGLLAGLTKTVLETALEAEMTEHLGHERHGAAEGPNVRNGTRSKTVLTEIGPVEIEVPRDREGTFEPQIVRKRRRRLDGIDEVVLGERPGSDDRGDRGSLRGGLRSERLQGHHLPDHGEGFRGAGRVGQPAARPRLPGGLHRRDPRQGP
jgi:hypothetical protein